MTIQYHGATFKSAFVSGADCDPDYPASITSGMILIAQLGVYTSGAFNGSWSFTAPAGWTQLWEQEKFIESAIDTGLEAVYWKIADGTETGQAVFTQDVNTGLHWSYESMYAFKESTGASITLTTNARSTGSVASGGDPITWSTVTAIDATDLHACIALIGGAIPLSAQGGYTERIESSTAVAQIYAMDKTVAAGATGAQTATASSGSSTYVATSIILSLSSSSEQVEIQPKVDWNLQGVFEDISQWVISASGTHRIAPPAQSITSTQGQISQAKVLLDNSSGRFSPLNTSGPIYSDIQDGKAYQSPIQINISIDGGATYTRVFTGVAKITGETTARPGQIATVTLDCRGLEEQVLNNRISTTWGDFVGYHNDGKNESEIISEWLQDAGIDAGDISVDSGQFIIPWTWLDDESPIEDAWLLAASAGGRFYASADGVFTYENIQHWLLSPHDTSQETIDRDDYSDIRPYYNDRELYEGVTVEVAVRQIGVPSVVYEPDEPISIPVNSTINVTARLRQPIYTYPSFTWQAVTSGGKNVTSDVSITPTVYAQRIDMQITNANATYEANLKNFTISASPVQGARTVDESATSTDGFWTARDGRTRTLRNVYIQNRAQGAMLAEFLRDRYESPRLFFNIINGPGKPGRRLGDHVTVNDDVIMSSSRPGHITALTWRWSVSGFFQDIEIVDRTSLYPHQGNYFVIGTDTLEAATSARVFY